MTTKAHQKQIDNYKKALEEFRKNIEIKLSKEKDLNLKSISDFLEDNSNIITEKIYKDILDFVLNTGHLWNKQKVENYLSEFFLNYLVLVKKNILLREFKKRIEKDNREIDILNSMLFISVYFRNKSKDINDSFYTTIKKNIDKMIEKSDDKVKEQIKKNIIKELNTFVKNTEYQDDSIFGNQLIKFLKQKEKNVEGNLSNEDIEQVIWDNSSLNSRLVEVEVFKWLKEQIFMEVEKFVEEDKRNKQKLLKESFLRKLIKEKWEEKWRENNIDVEDVLFQSYLIEIWDNLVQLLSKLGK